MPMHSLIQKSLPRQMELARNQRSARFTAVVRQLTYRGKAFWIKLCNKYFLLGP
jgi:hypothetical protein